MRSLWPICDGVAQSREKFKLGSNPVKVAQRGTTRVNRHPFSVLCKIGRAKSVNDCSGPFAVRIRSVQAERSLSAGPQYVLQLAFVPWRRLFRSDALKVAIRRTKACAEFHTLGLTFRN